MKHSLLHNLLLMEIKKYLIRQIQKLFKGRVQLS